VVSRLLIEYDGTDFSGWAVQPGLRTVRVGVHDRGGVDPAHPPGRGDLLREAHPEAGIVRELSPDQLDRHQAAAGRLAEKDAAHSAGSQPPDQPVAANLPRIVRLQRVHTRPP